MTQNREPVPGTEDSVFLRKHAVVRAAQWNGDNLDAMESLLGPYFDYYVGDGGGLDASVLTSAHHAWQNIYPGDWAVVEGERISVADPVEFEEQFAAGTPEYEYRVEFEHGNRESQIMPHEDVEAADRAGVWLHSGTCSDKDNALQFVRVAVDIGGDSIRVQRRTVVTVRGTWEQATL